MINEEFLHFVWKFQLLSAASIKCSREFSIQILNRGLHNGNAGPDFLNARIQIGSIIWCGDIEIHVKSSDWYAHKHQDDENYDR